MPIVMTPAALNRLIRQGRTVWVRDAAGRRARVERARQVRLWGRPVLQVRTGRVWRETSFGAIEIAPQARPNR